MQHTLLIGNTAQRRVARFNGLEHRTVLAEDLKIGYAISIFCRGIDGTKLLNTTLSNCWVVRVVATMLTVQSGMLENCGTEPSTFPVGNTKGTVAASRGLVAVGPAPGARGIVVAGTSASPTAEHCALVILRIPSQVRPRVERWLDEETIHRTDRRRYKLEVHRKLLHR